MPPFIVIPLPFKSNFLVRLLIKLDLFLLCLLLLLPFFGIALRNFFLFFKRGYFLLKGGESALELLLIVDAVDLLVQIEQLLQLLALLLAKVVFLLLELSQLLLDCLFSLQLWCRHLNG